MDAGRRHHPSMDDGWMDGRPKMDDGWMDGPKGHPSTPLAARLAGGFEPLPLTAQLQLEISIEFTR